MNTPRLRRRGSAYILVLFAGAAVSSMSLAAVGAARADARSVRLMEQRRQALVAAESGIDLVLYRLASRATWRDSVAPAGATLAFTSQSGHRITATITDPVDNDLTDELTDPVLVRVEARVGVARQVVEAEISARLSGIPALEVSLLSNAGITSDAISFGTLTSDQTIATNANAAFSIHTIKSDVQASGSIWGIGISGSQTAGVDKREIPDDRVFKLYTDQGVQISTSGLPRYKTLPSARRDGREGYGAEDYVFDQILLSPNNNPWGARSANGIYYIDCGGAPLHIRDCRIVGTLVLINAGAGSSIDRGVHMSPASPQYPALLCDGDFRLNVTSSTLAESLGQNFNPAGTPYQNVADADLTDVYPSLIEGLVHIVGDAEIRSTAGVVRGTLLATDDIFLKANLNATFEYDEAMMTNAPPGFSEGLIYSVARESIRRITD